MNRRIPTLLVAGMAALSVAACTAVQNERGYVPDPGAFQSVLVGKDTKQTVSKKLGDPSAAATFGDDTWYYISSHDVQTAFFATHSTVRKITAIKFDKAGQVADIHNYGLKDGRAVDYVDRETPTRGRDLTLLQQIFNAVPGNVGAAQAPQSDQNPGGGQDPDPGHSPY